MTYGLEINWDVFKAVNSKNKSEAFETMCRDLFTYEYINKGDVLQACPNNPGIEVEPILEKTRNDGGKRRKISFQAKFFSSNTKYEEIKDSAKNTANHYAGVLDLCYLYCNNSIDIHCDSYTDIQKIFKDANIELSLIADNAILDLIRKKYPEIAEEYFSWNIAFPDGNFSPYKNVPPINNSRNNLVMIGTPSYVNNQFITGLITDKIKELKSQIINLEWEGLEEKFEELANNDLEGINEYDTLYFYGYLISLHYGKQEEMSIYADKAGDRYYQDISLLQEFKKNYNDISFISFVKLLPESQATLIDLLFSNQKWDCILALHNDALTNENVIGINIIEHLNFYSALCCINKGYYDSGCEIFENIPQSQNKPKIKFFSLCCEILKINMDFWTKGKTQADALYSLLKQLLDYEMNVPGIVKQNGNFIASVEMQTYCVLARQGIDILQEANERYNGYSNEIRENEAVKYYVALCYEARGNIDEALKLYSSCEWTEQESIARNMMLCLIQKGEYTQAASAYEELSGNCKNAGTKGVYLFALSFLDKKQYQISLGESIDVYDKNLIDLYSIALYISDEELFNEVVLPPVKRLLSDENNILQLELQIKIGWVSLFAQFDQIILLDLVMCKIEQLNEIDVNISRAVYKALFQELNKEFEIQEIDEETKKLLKAAENIANRYVSENILRKEFLQILMMEANAEKSYIKMEKYAKELYATEKNEINARNVVSLLIRKGTKDSEDYKPYLGVLCNSHTPESSMMVAEIYSITGRSLDTDFYIYKALYYLDGKDDYNIYRRCLSLSMGKSQQSSEKEVCKVAKENTVVVLQKDDVSAEGLEGQKEFSNGERIICLDSETEFSDDNNHSLNIEHVNSSNLLYIQLYGDHLDEKIIINTEEYKIIDIQPRMLFINRFLLQKLKENPNESKGFISFLSADNPQEMIEQLKQAFAQDESLKDLLGIYHFEENNFGMPIDCLTRGDYDKYINIVKYLLLSKDQALYAGTSTPVTFSDNYIVPSLSTLVILCLLDSFSIFQKFEDKIIIPESYMEFFSDQYKIAVERQTNTSGLLLQEENGNIVLTDPDKSIGETWLKLIQECQKFNKYKVTDDERIKLELFEDVKMESFLNSLEINLIHLDAMILAGKENIVYICDDQFMRMIANLTKINNTNFSSLLYYYDLDFAVPYLIKLSETNYLYMPILYRDNEELNKIMHNLLKGKRKGRKYQDLFEVAMNFLEH